MSLDQSIKNSEIKLTAKELTLLSRLIEIGYIHIEWSDNEHWKTAKNKDWKINHDYLKMLSRIKAKQQHIDILFGKKYLSFYKENSNNPGFWVIDSTEIPNILKNETPIYSCDIPFHERPENIIRWKVCEGRGNFTHMAKLYNGNTFVKNFFGDNAVESANDYIEVQDSLYNSIYEYDWDIRQNVLKDDEEWFGFNTWGQAEKFARDNGFKNPVFKSI